MVADSIVDPKVYTDIQKNPYFNLMSAGERSAVNQAASSAIPPVNSVKLSSGEYVLQDYFNKLDDESKAQLKARGTEGFKVWFGETFTKVGDKGDYIKNEVLNPLPTDERDYLVKNGIDAWKGQYYTAVGPNKEIVSNTYLNSLPSDQQGILKNEGLESFRSRFYAEVGPNKELVAKDWLNTLSDIDRQTVSNVGLEAWKASDFVVTGPSNELVKKDWFSSLPKETQDKVMQVGVTAYNKEVAPVSSEVLKGYTQSEVGKLREHFGDNLDKFLGEWDYITKVWTSQNPYKGSPDYALLAKRWDEGPFVEIASADILAKGMLDKGLREGSTSLPSPRDLTERVGLQGYGENFGMARSRYNGRGYYAGTGGPYRPEEVTSGLGNGWGGWTPQGAAKYISEMAGLTSSTDNKFFKTSAAPEGWNPSWLQMEEVPGSEIVEATDTVTALGEHLLGTKIKTPKQYRTKIVSVAKGIRV